MAFSEDQVFEGHRLYYMLLHGYMEQYFKHNGIPLGAHFMYLNFDAILADDGYT
jgi:hypothetical protein